MSIINWGGGLSAMGSAVANTAGQAGLAQQKSDLEDQTAQLVNTMAIARDQSNQQANRDSQAQQQTATSALADKTIAAQQALEGTRASNNLSLEQTRAANAAKEGALNRTSNEAIYGTGESVTDSTPRALPNGNAGVLMDDGSYHDTGIKYTSPAGADKGWSMYQGPGGTGVYRVNPNAGIMQTKSGDGWQDINALPAGASRMGSDIGIKDSVRTNMVQGAAGNVLRQMDSFGKDAAGNDLISQLRASPEIGVHPDGYIGNVIQGVRRASMSDDQKNADTKIAGIIDEAIPVLTGGLRSSDSFRSFLLSQVPRSLGDDDNTAAQKWQVLRDNINGTSNAFRSRFASDPKNWGPGVGANDVQGIKMPTVAPAVTGSSGGAPSAAPAGPSINDLLKQYGQPQ